MFPKLVTLTVVLMCLMATLLVLRQQRIELANQTARLHAQILKTRHELWDDQSRAAVALAPHNLQRRIDDTQLALSPAIQPGAQAGPSMAQAAAATSTRHR